MEIMEAKGLKVLMISNDRKILTPGSAVFERMKEYGDLVHELHIVLLSTPEHGLRETKLSDKVSVYPTNTSSKFFYPFSAASLGKKIVFEKKFVRGNSLITTQDPFECGWAGLKIKNKWRIPLEVQLHTDPFSPYFSGPLNVVRKILARMVIPKADALRVVSEGVKRRIETSFPKKKGSIAVLPIYIDKKRILEGQILFDLRARLGWRFIILCVARLTPEKNLGLAVDVLARLHPYSPEAGLVIVGSGPEEENLKKRVEKLGLQKSVFFAGWQEELASYYKAANLFLQTSRFEGYGLALVEAGLSGLPVVTTPVGIATDLKDGVEAIVCPQDDPEYMFKAVYDLIENNQKRQEMKSQLQHTLEAKILGKEEYLERLRGAWLSASTKIRI